MSMLTIEDDDLGINLLHEARSQEQLAETKSLNNRTIDIVAIHGIGAHPFHTWSHWNADTGSVTNWICDSDMLHQDFPFARIMIFGYRSDWKGPQASDVTVSQVATNFLSCLKRARQGLSHRPILFIAHCAGGLVLMKALSLAYQQELQEDRYQQLFSSTIGAIFMGTPFRGVHGALADGTMIKIAQDRINHLENVVEKHEARIIERILDILRPGNESLDNLLNDFLQVESDLMPQLLCVYENQPSNVWKIIDETRQKEVLVPRACAVLDRVKSYMVDTHHFDLNKIKDRDQERYRRLVSEIAELLEDENADTHLHQRKTIMVSKNPKLRQIYLERQAVASVPFDQDVGLKYYRSSSTLEAEPVIMTQKRKRLYETDELESIRPTYLTLYRQAERQQPVYFMDALGRVTPFHLEFIKSVESLKAVLEANFTGYGSAAEMIRRGDYAITDVGTGRNVDLSRNWDILFQPGQAVMMSLIFRDDSPSSTNDCPFCANKCGQTSHREIQCANCGRLFRRTTEALRPSREVFTPEFSDTSDYRDDPVTAIELQRLCAPVAPRPDPIADDLQKSIAMFRYVHIVSNSVIRSRKVWCQIWAWVWYYNDARRDQRAGWCYVEDGDTIILEAPHDSKLVLFRRRIEDLDAGDDGFDDFGQKWCPRFTWRQGGDIGGWEFHFASFEDKEEIENHVRRAPGFKEYRWPR